MAFEMYEPSDDSFMLTRHVKELAKGKVLDMGTGSGIQAEAAVSSPHSEEVLGVDINRQAIEHCRKVNSHINFLESDLFSKIKGEKFDTIIFNPPYLPEDTDGITDPALIGGKQGFETIQEFIEQANDHLAEQGIILLLFSSLSKKGEVDRIILSNLFVPNELERKSIFFEELYVYKIHKSDMLRNLTKKGVSGLRRFSHGKRGIIFTGYKGKKKVAIKVQNPASRAIARIKNEGYWMKRLNKQGIGPNLISADETYVMYEFVEGEMLEDWLKKSTKAATAKMLKTVFTQMFTMDQMKTDKEEMHHPWKHILMQKNKPVMIDFERCNITIQPKNVTQFCQFVTSKLLSRKLEDKGIHIDKEKMKRLAAAYKKTLGKKEFEVILNEIR